MKGNSSPAPSAPGAGKKPKPYKSSFGHMRGMVIQLCSDEELFSTGEVWDCDEEDGIYEPTPTKTGKKSKARGPSAE